MKPIQVLLALLVVCVSLSGQALIKVGLNAGRHAAELVGSTGMGSLILHVLMSKFFWAGFVTMASGAVLYFVLLSTTNFTRALPVMGAIAYILIPIIGYFFLNERMALHQWAGLAMLIVGAVLLAK